MRSRHFGGALALAAALLSDPGARAQGHTAPGGAAQAGEAGAGTGVARRADLAEFRRKFFDEDRSYTAAARADAESRLARLEKVVVR